MVQTTPDVQDSTVIQEELSRQYMLPKDDVRVTTARIRLHDVLGPIHDKNPLPFIAGGSQCDVFGVTPTVVGKVDRRLSDERERTSRENYFRNCDFFFGADRVIHSFYPPQRGIVQAVHFQKNIAAILQNPKTVVLASGYAEDAVQDPNTYISVSESAVLRRGKLDREAFEWLYRNPHTKKLFTMIRVEMGLRERLEQLLSQIIFFAEKTKQPVDFLGYENLLLHPEESEWHFSINDPRIQLHDRKLLPLGREIFERFRKGDEQWDDMALVYLVNYVNFVRFVNGLADILGFDDTERLSVSPESVDWEHLLWLLHNFIERRKKDGESAISSHVSTVTDNDLAV